jgi:environmental stress-induced protein Ves
MRILACIRTADCPPQRWRNGGGWTRELFTWPGGDRPWQARVSVATIHAPGPFSVFPGVQRALALLEGGGVALSVNGREQHLTSASPALFFAGTDSVDATPLAGPTTDLNLMTVGRAGQLQRVLSGVQWDSPCEQRGLYAAADGVLTAGAGPAQPVSAGTLVWFADAAGVALAFVPKRTDGPLPAWWLGFSP